MSQDDLTIDAMRLYESAAMEYFSLRSDAARALLERVIALGQQHQSVADMNIYRRAHYNLGVIDAEGLLIPGVIDNLEKAISLGILDEMDSGRKAYLFNRLGGAYFLAGKYKDSVRSLSEALAINEEDHMARSFLVRALLALGRQSGGGEHKEEAQKQFEILKAKSPAWAKDFMLIG